jgi:hypothetical protein
MYPFVARQLAAERAKDLLTEADDMRPTRDEALQQLTTTRAPGCL